MKCTNKIIQRLSKVISLFLTITVLFTSCGKEYALSYSQAEKNSNFQMTDQLHADGAFHTFASDLCITVDDKLTLAELDDTRFYSAGLFDLKNKEVLYAKNVHTRLNPASLTKVMTALLALKYSNLDDIISCSKNVEITESGATLVGLKQGDHLTMYQALHCLLLYSANDAAVAIAEHVSGSVEAFAQLMNEEATLLGATNCNFVNPHGLTDENHYVTAYDLYLIFNEAIQYEAFVSIIRTVSFENSIYHDAEGNEKTLSFQTTNQFLRDSYHAPDGITVIGGKTGTTSAARSCLILLANDQFGNPYIAIILGDTERGLLYEDMIVLLSEIVKS